MSDLLFLARKFKAVGLIAILIQHKNQKEKKKREMQRASESAAARGGQQPPHLTTNLSGGGAPLDRAHGRKDSGDPTKSSQAHHRLKKKSGSKLKSGSGSRTEKLKFIASSPSNLSSGGVPTRYPYGEMTSSTTT